MQKLNEKKILGTVPKKLQLAETFWDCPEFSKKGQNQKGITLIALIITIIVMLILVGVAINIALNGGLFGKAEKATYQTEASTVKEQLELAKVLERINNGGSAVSDYSRITVNGLPDLDQKTKTKFASKIVVSKNGDICYNPEEVTDTEEIEWLKEIGIMPNTSEPEDPYKDLYNVAYEKTVGGMQMELVLYKNGMYTVKMPGMYGGAIYLDEYNFIQEEIVMNSMMTKEDNTIIITISEDNNTFALSGYNEYFDGNWIRNDSKTDNYNPIYLGEEKDIYANAVYYSEGEAITISSERIIYDQDTILSSANGIKLADYDKTTNTTITTQNNGTKIIYNGKTYDLITKDQLNTK